MAPIASYGIILYAMVKGEPRFLLYQSRDTFEYIDFIRGLWRREGDIMSLFAAMTEEERTRIREFTFQELWDDLWVGHDCRIYRDGFERAKRKYNSVCDRIPYILDHTTTFVDEAPWGFPKGKKNGYKESAIGCAKREFYEETQIDCPIKFVSKAPLVEHFRGSNGKPYSTYYYIGKTTKTPKGKHRPTISCIRTQTISEEAAEIKWMSYEEACEKLHPRRQKILKKVMETIAK